MKNIFLFDIRSYASGIFIYIALLSLLIIGLFTGNQFNLSAGNGVYLNSPYTIGFMLGMLSLLIIFLATIFSSQLLFKEWDTRFDLIIFSTSIAKRDFAAGRFLSVFILTVTGFLLMVTGFAMGQHMRSGQEIRSGINIVHYLYPVLIFGVFNSLLTCSILYFIAWSTRKKLLVAVGGLLLYVLYMVLLLFTNAPFMAGSLPQSIEAQRISALADPFGISAYFLNSRDFTVQQRNTIMVPLSGYFLLNRLMVLGLSALFILSGYRFFPFSEKKQRSAERKAVNPIEKEIYQDGSLYVYANTRFNFLTKWKSIRSFVRTDLTYIFKSIALAVTSILLLFYVGMEMYAEIEKGIRLPEKYASSGLMATTISENFHFFGLLLSAYFINDISWRSKGAGFSMLENTTFYATSKLIGHWLSAGILLLYFTVLLILQGLVFQCFYNYPIIDANAYRGAIVFNTFPLLLFSGFLLLINDWSKTRYIALAFSLLAALLASGPVSKKLLPLPLLRIFSGYTGPYSDFNGYGIYLPSFLQKWMFGVCIIGILWLLHDIIKNLRVTLAGLICAAVLAISGLFPGKAFLQGYAPQSRQMQLNAAAQYEHKYRKYQHLPQPTITDVKTRIDLYPNQNAYSVEGTYLIKNLSGEPINKILVGFNEDFRILQAGYSSTQETIKIDSPITELVLKHPLGPNDSAKIHFKMSYHWLALNGHQPFNAIIENGSFMRISRYYPQLGYQAQSEIADSVQRKAFALGAATQSKKLDDPRSRVNDFIQLDMLILTTPDQTAVGTGELVNHWKENNRNYFHYKTNTAIPFRFALSSATYNIKSTVHNGIRINVLFNAKHPENVDHLINNAKLTLDYCRNNFGPYPFKSVTFAEISSFTRGFAATVYPAAIFMTEDMIFHANIKADKQQDVINELAGHELSHLWWGNNQISPDDREGAPMLTETLAMYTEMMLYKKMHGRKQMMDRVKVHQQIYDEQKGFSVPQPLYMVTDENTHISYSKGAVAMVQLSELIGEEKVNRALRNFLQSYKYPNPIPVTTDLIDEFLKISEPKHHAIIKKLFMSI